jgi:hypothetical protein
MTNRENPLDTIDTLKMRLSQLETAMRQPGGARVTEEQELQSIKRKLEAEKILCEPSKGRGANLRA